MGKVHDERIDSPQGEVFHVTFDLRVRRGLIEIVEMRGKIDAAHRTDRRRRAAPRAGGESALVITAGVEKSAHTIQHSARITAGDPHRSVGIVGDLVSFRADARLDGQFDRHRRIA